MVVEVLLEFVILLLLLLEFKLQSLRFELEGDVDENDVEDEDEEVDEALRWWCRWIRLTRVARFIGDGDW